MDTWPGWVAEEKPDLVVVGRFDRHELALA
jgi:hypothetical protein